MSTINKKPFIKSLLESMSPEDLQTLSVLIDGGGDQNPLKRTANPIDSIACPHIGPADKGVHLCNLTINYTNFLGYLIYNDNYCVLISFTDAQVLKIFEIDGYDANTINEAINILELRSALYETMSGDADNEAFEDVEIKVHYSDLDFSNIIPVVTNQEIVSKVIEISQKVHRCIHAEAPNVSYEYQGETYQCWLMCSGSSGFGAPDAYDFPVVDSIICGDYRNQLGFAVVDIGGDSGLAVVPRINANTVNEQAYNQALMTLLATDPTKCIKFQIRVETGKNGNAVSNLSQDNNVIELKFVSNNSTQSVLRVLMFKDGYREWLSNDVRMTEDELLSSFNSANGVEQIQLFSMMFGTHFNRKEITYIAFQDTGDISRWKYTLGYSVEYFDYDNDDEPDDGLINIMCVDLQRGEIATGGGSFIDTRSGEKLQLRISPLPLVIGSGSGSATTTQLKKKIIKFEWVVPPYQINDGDTVSSYKFYKKIGYQEEQTIINQIRNIQGFSNVSTLDEAMQAVVTIMNTANNKIFIFSFLSYALRWDYVETSYYETQVMAEPWVSKGPVFAYMSGSGYEYKLSTVTELGSLTQIPSPGISTIESSTFVYTITEETEYEVTALGSGGGSAEQVGPKMHSVQFTFNKNGNYSLVFLIPYNLLNDTLINQFNQMVTSLNSLYSLSLPTIEDINDLPEVFNELILQSAPHQACVIIYASALSVFSSFSYSSVLNKLSGINPHSPLIFSLSAVANPDESVFTYELKVLDLWASQDYQPELVLSYGFDTTVRFHIFIDNLD